MSMVGITEYLDFVHQLLFWKNTVFQKLELFSLSGPSEGVYLSHWITVTRLPPSTGTNWVGASPPFTWGWKQIEFPKYILSDY
jgi:hypothetical protein